MIEYDYESTYYYILYNKTKKEYDVYRKNGNGKAYCSSYDYGKALTILKALELALSLEIFLGIIK